MTTRLFTVILATVALILCAVPAAGQIAFMSDRDGDLDVFVFDTDTGAVRRLTPPGEIEYGATWAHDGSYVYFVRYKEGDQNIWRVKPDGTGLEKVTEGTHQRNINDLSPDGKRMLITSRRENPQGDAYTMDIDGKNVRRITDNKFFEVGGAYSPDGKQIAMGVQIVPSTEKGWMGNSELFLFDLDGKQLKQLTKSDSTFDALPAFSPDGKKIAYHSCEHGSCGVSVLDLATGKTAQLTKGDPDSRWPRWSPDGKWIVYTRLAKDGSDIWLMRPDGSGKRGLVVRPGRDEIATFGPKMVKIPGN